MGRMVITLALLAGLAVTAHGQPAGEKPDKECCDTKTVGGVTYSLIGQMDTKMYNCLSDCIYMKEGQEGGKFCFAMGDLQVECNDEEMEGSEKPPMEGSEMPPMEGSEMPPMQGSEKPPMEGCIWWRSWAARSSQHEEAGVGRRARHHRPEVTDQCIFEHDKLRDLCDGTFSGQNAWQSGTDYEYYDYDVNPEIGQAVQSWYDEVTSPGFDAANINPFVYGDGYGHYTAVVWADTDRVGCGRVYFEDTDGWYKHLVICNYAIAANLVGGVMYEAGEKCSNCPAGYSCDATYDGLCVKN